MGAVGGERCLVATAAAEHTAHTLRDVRRRRLVVFVGKLLTAHALDTLHHIVGGGATCTPGGGWPVSGQEFAHEYNEPPPANVAERVRRVFRRRGRH